MARNLILVCVVNFAAHRALVVVRRIANPCLSPLVDSYLTIVSEAQKQIGVNRAAPLLENTIIGLRSDTRSRAQVAAFMAAVSLARDVTRCSLDLFS